MKTIDVIAELENEVTGDRSGGNLPPNKNFKQELTNLVSASKDMVSISNRLHKLSLQKKYIEVLGDKAKTFTKNMAKVKMASTKLLTAVKAAKDSAKKTKAKATVGGGMSIDDVITQLED